MVSLCQPAASADRFDYKALASCVDFFTPMAVSAITLCRCHVCDCHNVIVHSTTSR
jgi:hypothetical protein